VGLDEEIEREKFVVRKEKGRFSRFWSVVEGDNCWNWERYIERYSTEREHSWYRLWSCLWCCEVFAMCLANTKHLHSTRRYWHTPSHSTTIRTLWCMRLMVEGGERETRRSAIGSVNGHGGRLSLDRGWANCCMELGSRCGRWWNGGPRVDSRTIR